MFLKKNTSLLGLLNDELKMNQIKVFLLCFKKGINLMFQTNINCFFKGRHSNSNFTNVLIRIFWISKNIISKSVTLRNPMMRSYKYSTVFFLLYIKTHTTLDYLMNRPPLLIKPPSIQNSNKPPSTIILPSPFLEAF